MTTAPTPTATRAPLPADLRLVLLLSSVPLAAACFLPWVLLRPNRLAAGTYLHLPPAWVAVGLLIAVAFPLTARRWPQVTPALGSAAFTLGVWGLGHSTAQALQGQAEFARASASSGLWLWLLGSGVALYAARQAAPRVGRLPALLGWAWVPLALLLVLGGTLSHWSVVQELAAQRGRFTQELAQHLKLVLAALALAVLIGAPAAVWASRNARFAAVTLGLAGGIQTIPSLALLGLLIAPLSALANAIPALRQLGVSGIGTAPALSAMTLYALLPVLRNGVVALRGVAPDALDAARGMGMTDAQRFWRVQLPLALPVWLSGVRQAAVLLVGVASVAQLIGAGGLGYFIFSGLQSGASDLILLGAIPAAALAILVDTLLRAAETLLGHRRARRAA